MTSTARQPLRVSLEIPARAVELVWDISTRAGQALAASRAVRGAPIVGLAVRLSRVGENGFVNVVADALTAAGSRSTLLRADHAHARWLLDGALEHVDVEDVLACTLRHDARAGALFARCPLLARLGIPPGSYSLRGAEIV